jgi:hypothetical protein
MSEGFFHIDRRIWKLDNPPPTLYVANRGVTMKLRFGGKAVPT